MIEENLEDLLELEEVEQLNKRIKKKVNQTIFKKVFISLLFFFGCGLGIYGVIEYQEKQEQLALENYEKAQNYYNAFDKPHTGYGYLFSTLMETSIEMRFPGISCFDGDYSINSPKKYTNIYRTHLQKISKDKVIGVGPSNLEITIGRSKRIGIVDEDDLLTDHYHLFKSPNQTADEYNYFPTISNDDIQEIIELPDSCVLDVAISFNQQKTTSEIISLIHQYPKSLFTWLAVDSSQRNPTLTDGINIYQNSVSDYELDLTQQYPHLYFDPNEISKETIEHCYKSQCQFLLDNPDFLNIEGNFFTKDQIQHKLNQANQMIQETGELQFIGIYGTIKKADLLDIIQHENIIYGDILDIKLSILQK